MVTKIITPIFVLFNLLIIILSIAFVIWNLVATFFTVSSEWISEVSAATNVDVSTLNTIILLGTILVSFFSGLAAMGMEAANFRKYWRTKVFVVCGMSILKLKMWIYIGFTSIIGIGLLVVTGLFHGQLINLDYSTFLSGLIITESSIS